LGLSGEEKAEFERRLRDYRSRDLEVPMRSVTEDQMIEEYGELVMGYYSSERVEIMLLKRWELEAVDHEIAHSIAHRILGTTRPEKYRKYLLGEYAEAIEKYISNLHWKTKAKFLLMDSSSRAKVYLRILYSLYGVTTGTRICG